MEKLISIIVPIYNVECYIEACIESLINQTYKNIEILLINDGSTDNSGNIIDKYSYKDSRIRVFHKNNGGLSDARNYGLKKFKGEYVCFVDADDYVEAYFIEKLYKAINKNKVEISQCSINYFINEKILKSYGYGENQVVFGKEMLIDATLNNHFIENTVVWNKMYNKKIFKELRFPKGKIHEDEFVTYKNLYNKKIAIIKENLYFYRKNEESITGKKYNLKRLDILEAFQERIEYFFHKDADLYFLSIYSYLYSLIYQYVNLKKYINNYKEYVPHILSKYKKYSLILIKTSNKYISKKMKLKCLFFLLFPNLFYLLKNHIYRGGRDDGNM